MQGQPQLGLASGSDSNSVSDYVESRIDLQHPFLYNSFAGRFATWCIGCASGAPCRSLCSYDKTFSPSLCLLTWVTEPLQFASRHSRPNLEGSSRRPCRQRIGLHSCTAASFGTAYLATPFLQDTGLCGSSRDISTLQAGTHRPQCLPRALVLEEVQTFCPC